MQDTKKIIFTGDCERGQRPFQLINFILSCFNLNNF